MRSIIWQGFVILFLVLLSVPLDGFQREVRAERNHFIILIDQSGSMRYRFRFRENNGSIRIFENTANRPSPARIRRINTVKSEILDKITSGHLNSDVPPFDQAAGDVLDMAQFGLVNNFGTYNTDNYFRIVTLNQRLLFNKTYGLRTLAIPAAMKHFGHKNHQKTFSRLFVFIISDNDFNDSPGMSEIDRMRADGYKMGQAAIFMTQYHKHYKEKQISGWVNIDDSNDLICSGCNLNGLEVISGIECRGYEMIPLNRYKNINSLGLLSTKKIIMQITDNGNLQLPLQKGVLHTFDPQPDILSENNAQWKELPLTFSPNAINFHNANQDIVKRLTKIAGEYVNIAQLEQAFLMATLKSEHEQVQKMIEQAGTITIPLTVKVSLLSTDPLYGKMHFTNVRQLHDINIQYDHPRYFDCCDYNRAKRNLWLIRICPEDFSPLMRKILFALFLAIIGVIIIQLIRTPKVLENKNECPFENPQYPEPEERSNE